MVLLRLTWEGLAPMQRGTANPKPRPGEQHGPSMGKLRHCAGTPTGCGMLGHSHPKNTLLQAVVELCRCEAPVETDSSVDGS